MHSILISFLVAFFAYLALAMPTPDTDTPDLDLDLDLPTTPKTWEVHPFPGEPAINLTGTIKEVDTQLKQLNPNYDEDWKAVPVSVGIDKAEDV
ncbi:hypothetical protein BDV12DRAFT_193246 [Aspergillus spectabilis]